MNIMNFFKTKSTSRYPINLSGKTIEDEIRQMSKSEIYLSMIVDVALHHRRVYFPVHKTKRKMRINDLDGYYESLLVHSLTGNILNKQFTLDDINFLNGEACYYTKNAGQKVCINYPIQVLRIKRLFELVPDEFRSLLKWPGPK